MYRTAPRYLLRQVKAPSRSGWQSTRNVSTQPPHMRRRTLKNSLARWGLAGAGIYWYNTSPLFVEDSGYSVQDRPEVEDEQLPTLASLSPSSRFKPPHPSDSPTIPATPTFLSPPSINPKSPDPGSATTATPPNGPEALEEEAAQEGAFNEETGEINWDCPCLGGMAHGPCGPEFREAFSCFVFSKEEPKGMDCIDKFKGMQSCFRDHPDIYGAELEDDEEAEIAVLRGEGDDAAPIGGTSRREEPRITDTDESSSIAASQSEDSATMAAIVAVAKTPADSFVEDQPTKTIDGRTSNYDGEKSAHHAAGMPEKVSNVRSEDAGETRDRALSARKQVQEQFGEKEVQSESEPVVPKAAHDAT